eukprot:6177659-Pleurochrysis_carterae.AAC.1
MSREGACKNANAHLPIFSNARSDVRLTLAYAVLGRSRARSRYARSMRRVCDQAERIDTDGHCADDERRSSSTNRRRSVPSPCCGPAATAAQHTASKVAAAGAGILHASGSGNEVCNSSLDPARNANAEVVERNRRARGEGLPGQRARQLAEELAEQFGLDRGVGQQGRPAHA